MPSSLVSYLQTTSAKNILKADCFLIALPNGQTIGITEGQWDITLTQFVASPVSGTPGWTGPTTTFYATKYGVWSRGAITSEASFDMSANTMALTCVPQPNTAYPGLTIGILNAALNGLFDGASVSVYTAYMPIGSYGNVSNGIETKWFGTITSIKDINRTHVEFECADPMYLLGGSSSKIPKRTFKSDCPWSFADGNCAGPGAAVTGPAPYTVAFTAKTGSTQWVLTPTSAFTQATGYFTQGVVTCTSGANNGLAQTVKLHDASGNLELMQPWLMPAAPGDTFSVIKGCDKTMSTCAATKTAAGASTNNILMFGGTPFVPVPSTAL